MPKKIPMRQCLGCREMKPKHELIRVVRAPDGEQISLDFRGKAPGRGARNGYFVKKLLKTLYTRRVLLYNDKEEERQ